MLKVHARAFSLSFLPCELLRVGKSALAFLFLPMLTRTCIQQHAGLGTMMHNLPLIYLGYGLLGGLGFAFGYISPVTNLIKWFPDKRGLATGLGVMAFGGGALLCAPLSTKLFAQ